MCPIPKFGQFIQEEIYPFNQRSQFGVVERGEGLSHSSSSSSLPPLDLRKMEEAMTGGGLWVFSDVLEDVLGRFFLYFVNLHLIMSVGEVIGQEKDRVSEKSFFILFDLF